MKKTLTLKEERIWKPFVLNVSVVILLVVLGIFIGILIRNKKMIEDEMLTRAQSYFHNILLTRRWNADHGGVWVEKKNGMQSNPYLENPDLQTVDGRILTKKNPALMTREISEYAQKSGMFTFHITSLKPLNPGNVPDPFETDALKAFEKGQKEIFTKENLNGQHYYRYMAPLVTEQACLQCHGQQGYTVGSIRGGISVKFEITNIEKKVKANNATIAVMAVVTIFLVLGVIYLFILRLMKRLASAHDQIKRMAVIDELSGCYNRRYFFEQLDLEFKRSKRFHKYLSCIMLDIDFFKKVNDTYGHPVGDIVLKKVSQLLTSHSRTIDIVARYGGEEFTALLPETKKEGALNLAEKWRNELEKLNIIIDDETSLQITASFGVAALSPAQLKELANSEEILKIADDSLYNAKKNGRNRVESNKNE